MKVIWKILSITLCVLPFAASANTAQTYIDMFGRAPLSDRVERAHEIFEKLKRSTNHHTSSTELIIINSDAKPWASALQDDSVILSKGALEVLYNNADTDLADARLAFVLGHELAHQFRGDHVHEQLREMPMSRSERQQSTTVIFSDGRAKQMSDQTNSYTIEHNADIHGFIYASVAGFRTDLLIPGYFNAEDNEDSDFLQYWVKQTGTYGGDRHPAAIDRTNLLSAVFATIDVNYFKYGTMLAHFGHFDLAQDFLVKFEKPFPSKVFMNSEVLNVLGYLNLQRARKLTPPKDRYRFWLPTILDTNIKFPKKDIPKTRGSDRTMQLRQQALDNAIDYFSSAAKMDSENITSQINLIVANILNDSYGTAKDLARKALDKNSNNPMLQHLHAIARYADGVNASELTQRLADLAARNPTDQYMVYNLARVLKEQRYHIDATRNWRILARSLATIPDNYQTVICTELQNTCRPKMLDVELLNPSIDQLMPVHKDSILSLNGIIQMVALGAENYGLQTTQDLINFVGQPLEKTPTRTGELWAYGPRWTAKVEGQIVKEIWISNVPDT